MKDLKIPESVRVGGIDYSVETTDEILLIDGKQCVGIHDAFSAKIKLSSMVSVQRKIEVFLHEVLHAIIYDRQIDTEKWDEEQIVDALGNGLADFCKNNNFWFWFR